VNRGDASGDRCSRVSSRRLLREKPAQSRSVRARESDAATMQERCELAKVGAIRGGRVLGEPALVLQMPAERVDQGRFGGR
jgi:hypothetical protein